MRLTASILGTCALLALPIQAGAGQCTTEIDSVTKLLASRDAGSGPTSGTNATTPGQHPPTTAMSQEDRSTEASRAAAESNRPQQPPTATMNRETTGMSTPGADTRRDEHPPTATMNQQLQGGAASPQDAQRQNQGQPTAAQEASGPMRGQIAMSHSMAAAMTQLERARLLDQQGKETECLGALGQAKLMTGIP